jgi:hypothetical protein
MKKLLALALVALMAGGASAQMYDGANMFGMFFSNTDFSEASTNHVNAFAPFNGYIVLLNSEVASIGGYEVGITISDPGVFVLLASGPNGWTNFGSATNHLCGYMTALPCSGDADNYAVLGQMQMLYTGVNSVTISYGPASPSSFNNEGPGIAEGSNPDNLVLCHPTTPDGIVATINGNGVVATENHTLTSVKALFE